MSSKGLFCFVLYPPSPAHALLQIRPTFPFLIQILLRTPMYTCVPPILGNSAFIPKHWYWILTSCPCSCYCHDAEEGRNIQAEGITWAKAWSLDMWYRPIVYIQYRAKRNWTQPLRPQYKSVYIHSIVLYYSPGFSCFLCNTWLKSLVQSCIYIS